MILQYISDNKGEILGVYIPIQEWESLKTKFEGLEDEFEEQSKKEILQGLKQAVDEMNLIKEGKLKARSAKNLLKELENDPEIPEEHKSIIRNRIKNSDPDKLISWEEARKKLNSKS